MPSYEQLREDVAALIAVPGPVRRASVAAVLERNPPADEPVATDLFDDATFDTAVFG